MSKINRMACGVLVMEMGAHMKPNRAASAAPGSISGFTSGPASRSVRQVQAIYLTESGRCGAATAPLCQDIDWWPRMKLVRRLVNVAAVRCPVALRAVRVSARLLYGPG